MQLIANDQLIADVVAASVRSSSLFSAGHFELTLRLAKNLWRWASDSQIDVDVRFRTTSSSAYVSVVQGRVDSVRMDPIAGVVMIEGRDYAAGLIDTVISETFTNQTASDIATQLAQRHGLNPVVDPTSAIIGRYYHNQHDSVALDAFCGQASEWDVLCFLAQQEGCDLWVEGTRLYFCTLTGNEATIVVRPGDLIDLRMDRMLGLAGDLEVVVKTWNSHEHRSEVRCASRSQPNADVTLGNVGTRRYVLLRPNLTSDAAQQLAEKRLADLCAQDRTVIFTMPGEVTLFPRSTVLLDGTGTQFDTAYRVDEISRRFSPSSGFVQRVRASSIYASPLPS